MRILHCNTYSTQGGAAIAAQRLHASLLEAGQDSQFLTVDKKTDSLREHTLAPTKAGKLAYLLLPQVDKLPAHLYRSPKEAGHCTFAWLPFRNHKAVNAFKADIIHLHWIAESLYPHSLSRLQGPAVWTLHDTWAFTGGCHTVQQCTNYTRHCGFCPQLSSKRQRDLAHLCAVLKKKALQKLRPTIVSPSRSIMDKARNSELLAGLNIVHIPHGVDPGVFKPYDQQLARSLLQLPQEGPLILFGAMLAASDPNKGYDLLMQALQSLAAQTKAKPVCVVFGASHGNNTPLPFPAIFLGRLHDPLTLALAYSAADIFVCPSREESFSNTTLEALACGTPVAGFEIGGLADMIETGTHGYLARPHDPDDLAQGMAAMLDNPEKTKVMGLAARQRVEEQFSSTVTAQQHCDLYDGLCEQAGHSAKI